MVPSALARALSDMRAIHGIPPITRSRPPRLEGLIGPGLVASRPLLARFRYPLSDVTVDSRRSPARIRLAAVERPGRCVAKAEGKIRGSPHRAGRVRQGQERDRSVMAVQGLVVRVGSDKAAKDASLIDCRYVFGVGPVGEVQTYELQVNERDSVTVDDDVGRRGVQGKHGQIARDHCVAQDVDGVGRNAGKGTGDCLRDSRDLQLGAGSRHPGDEASGIRAFQRSQRLQ